MAEATKLYTMFNTNEDAFPVFNEDGLPKFLKEQLSKAIVSTDSVHCYSEHIVHLYYNEFAVKIEIDFTDNLGQEILSYIVIRQHSDSNSIEFVVDDHLFACIYLHEDENLSDDLDNNLKLFLLIVKRGLIYSVISQQLRWLGNYNYSPEDSSDMYIMYAHAIGLKKAKTLDNIEQSFTKLFPFFKIEGLNFFNYIDSIIIDNESDGHLNSNLFKYNLFLKGSGFAISKEHTFDLNDLHDLLINRSLFKIIEDMIFNTYNSLNHFKSKINSLLISNSEDFLL